MASVRDLSGHPLPTPGPITAAMDLTGWASWMTSPQLIRDANRRYVGADPYVKGPLNAQVLKRVEIKVAGSSAFELNPPLHGLFLLAGSNKCRFGRGARDLNRGLTVPNSEAFRPEMAVLHVFDSKLRLRGRQASRFEAFFSRITTRTTTTRGPAYPNRSWLSKHLIELALVKRCSPYG